MSDPLVSVITRTCNRPAFLEEAVASVAAQTYPRVEHVVVNDGGADVSAIVDRRRSHVTTRYLSPGRVGRCKAGNLGLAAATGRFIAWLDDDDLYYPDHVATLCGALGKSGLKVAYSDADRVVQTLDPATRAYREVSRTPCPSFEWSKITLWRRGDLHLVTVMHDRECYERLGGFDETLPVLEDLDLLSRFAQDYDFHHVGRTTAAFRVRDDNTNAITALREDFVHVRTTFYKKYAHIVMPELLAMVEHGALELTILKNRVAELAAEVARLRGGGRS